MRHKLILKRLLPILLLLIPLAYGLVWLFAALVTLLLLYIAIQRLAKRPGLRKWSPTLLNMTILVYTVFLSAAIKVFILDIYEVPSSSMEGTLLVNDVILVNKLVYGPRLPVSLREISWINFFFKKQEKTSGAAGPYQRLKGIAAIHRGDVLVNRLHHNYFVVKRCVALAGDTIFVKNGEVYTNGRKEQPFQGIQRFYTGTSGLKEPFIPNKGYQLFTLPEGRNWNYNSFGPLIIPRKGMTVELNDETYAWYRRLISKYERAKLTRTAKLFQVNQKPAHSYTFKKNYYFLVGDNRMNALDSRSFGPVPEENIIGKVQMVLYSHQHNSLRWNRIFRPVY